MEQISNSLIPEPLFSDEIESTTIAETFKEEKIIKRSFSFEV